MKGFTKAIKRTPQLVTSKVGLSKKSSDPEFDELNRKFTGMEGAAEALLKDSKVFTDSVNSLLLSGAAFATHFTSIFQPLGSEHGLQAAHPEAAVTIDNIGHYQTDMEDLRATLAPEMELIESRVVGPIKELQGILKIIRKNITKRDHKLVDFDRFNNSLTKLREKKEKSLSDEKNLFKLEQDFEQAVNEYETYNNALKTDLPTFMELGAQFIEPLFHSFYYMQLNIFYLMLEKLQTFSDQKFQTGGSANEIINAYEEKRGDARERVEALTVTQRVMHTSAILRQNRAASGGSLGTTGLSRGASTASSISGGTSLSRGISTNTGSLGRANTTASTSSGFPKKAPPPPPGSSFAAAPPPYTSAALQSAASIKRAPPPPPVKPKPPVAAKPVQYVTALYDYDAQADGDLSFRAGDKIEIVEKSESAEDWWTGKVNGLQGVFPGNYVQV